jgi:hypothetical protein
VKNEIRGEWKSSRSFIDSTTWDIELSVFINYPSYKNGNPSSSIPPFIIKNQVSPQIEEREAHLRYLWGENFVIQYTYHCWIWSW